MSCRCVLSVGGSGEIGVGSGRKWIRFKFYTRDGMGVL